MPLPVSTLSSVCTQIADYLGTQLNAAANNLRVRVGSPASVEDGAEHQLNLFFYRFEPAAFGAQVRPDEPWRIRLFCLITPFGIAETVTPTQIISAGENDLRLLGEVMRLFHEAPILGPMSAGGLTVRMQVVFLPLSDDQLNQIWSTQAETTYRPSAAYEMSLLPVVPSQPRMPALRVGRLGAEARAGMDRHSAFGGDVQAPPALRVRVDTAAPAWVPALCWVYRGGCLQTLAFDVDAPAFAAWQPAIWLAGDPAAAVQLVWEQWQPSGWMAAGGPVDAQPYGPALDPDDLPDDPGNFPLPVSIPFTLPAGQSSTQGLLHARRSVVPPGGGAARTLRSNPLLLTLYRTAP